MKILYFHLSTLHKVHMENSKIQIYYCIPVLKCNITFIKIQLFFVCKTLNCYKLSELFCCRSDLSKMDYAASVQNPKLVFLKNCYKVQLKLLSDHCSVITNRTLMGQSHEIFDPRFFSFNCTPESPDSWAKTVLHIDWNSRRYSIKFHDENRLCRGPIYAHNKILV
jgi:hypothetical protein